MVPGLLSEVASRGAGRISAEPLRDGAGAISACVESRKKIETRLSAVVLRAISTGPNYPGYGRVEINCHGAHGATLIRLCWQAKNNIELVVPCVIYGFTPQAGSSMGFGICRAYITASFERSAKMEELKNETLELAQNESQRAGFFAACKFAARL